MNADLAPRTICMECGAQVVPAKWPDGKPVFLDPKARVATVCVRSKTEIEIWPTTEAMVDHAAVCAAAIVRRTMGGAAEVKEKMVTIQIDRLPFTVAGGVLTGQQILSLAPPRPIENLELWLVGCGSKDEKVEAAAFVDVREGLRFFTAPAFINNSQHTCLNCGTVWERIHLCPAVVKEQPAAPAEVGA